MIERPVAEAVVLVADFNDSRAEAVDWVDNDRRGRAFLTRPRHLLPLPWALSAKDGGKRSGSAGSWSETTAAAAAGIKSN
jgi:hypothetical protein